jgi:hypothetical protein
VLHPNDVCTVPRSFRHLILIVVLLNFTSATAIGGDAEMVRNMEKRSVEKMC